MVSVGQKLRQARESKGLTIQQVAGQTKISARYLQAIESDDPKSLPGAFFYKSFVQQYAGTLGVPMEELRWELDRVVPPPERTIDDEPNVAPEPATRFLAAPEPLTNQLGFRLFLLLLMLVACSAVYALWDKMQRTSAAEATTAKPAPPPTTTPAPRAPPSTAALPPAKVESLEAPLSNGPVVSVETPGAPTTNTQGTVIVSAVEPAWFQMKLDGKVAYAGVLEPNETKTFDHFTSGVLLAGNAGGLNVVFNGKKIGEVGPRGQVRTVVFSPDKFEVQQPVKKDPATGYP